MEKKSKLLLFVDKIYEMAEISLTMILVSFMHGGVFGVLHGLLKGMEKAEHYGWSEVDKRPLRIAHNRLLSFLWSLFLLCTLFAARGMARRGSAMNLLLYMVSLLYFIFFTTYLLMLLSEERRKIGKMQMAMAFQRIFLKPKASFFYFSLSFSGYLLSFVHPVTTAVLLPGLFLYLYLKGRTQFSEEDKEVELTLVRSAKSDERSPYEDNDTNP